MVPIQFSPSSAPSPIYNSVEDNGVVGSIPQAQIVSLKKRPYVVPIQFSPPSAPSPIYNSVEDNGVVQLSAGRIYKGQLLDGVPNGEGVVIDTTVNEIVYSGMWEDGMYNGMGTLYVQGEQVAHGEFIRGVLVKGSRLFKNGTSFVGEFQNNTPNGSGRFVLPSGIVVEGTWNQFKPMGEMIYYFPGYEPIRYDMEKADDITKWEIEFRDSAIVLHDTHFANGDISFIFHFNGDIFIGTTKQQVLPLNGDFYQYCGNRYLKMKYGEKLLDVGIKGIEIKSSPHFHYKCVQFVK